MVYYDRLCLFAEEVAVTNIALNLTVDFDRKVLHGHVELDVKINNKNATEVVCIHFYMLTKYNLHI
jgi:hypothetical protein